MQRTLKRLTSIVLLGITLTFGIPAIDHSIPTIITGPTQRFDPGNGSGGHGG